jgi:hemin uptake protein HemP
MSTPHCEGKPGSADTAAELAAPLTPRDAVQPIASEHLLQGRACVMIRHGDAVYALRATRAGKLILTK